MSAQPKLIPLAGVKSSQIESIGHDGSTLAVKFKGGGVYHYPGVTADQFAELKKADSIGRHFGQHIRTKFKGTKI